MAKTIFYSLAALVRKILFCHSKIHFISSRHRVISSIYCIKASGIAGGNKLIKTIRYPHMWRYRWFRWYHVCLLNCTWIRWCIIKTSSGLPWKSSAIFGHLREFSENVRERSSGLRNNFGESSEIFGKWSEIFEKSSKTPSSVCLYNKKNLTR